MVAKKRAKNSKLIILLIILLLVILGVVIWATPLSKQFNSADKASLAKLEDACPDNKSEDFDCISNYFKDITKTHGPQASMGQLRESYETVNSVKTFCHPITHVIGRTSAEKYNTVQDAYAHGDNFCWSGYYHGVMEQVVSDMGKDGVIEQADEICEGSISADRYSFFHYNCVHGLGHGFMLITDNELFESLVLCDSLNGEWEKSSCHGGVFMENIMSHTHSNIGHHTKYLKNDDPLYPCTAVDDKYKATCHMMQTSHALDVLNQDFSAVFALCDGIEEQYRSSCYRSLGRDASGSTVSDIDKTRELCMLGTNDLARQHCVTGAVKDFISFHHNDTEAKAFCDSLENNLRSNCHETATEYYRSFDR